MSESMQVRLSAIETQLSALRSEMLVSAERFKLVSVSGALEIDLKSGVFTIGTPAGKVPLGDLEKDEHKLAGVGSGEQEQPQLCIDPGQSVVPLRMGNVTFYGESARQIRTAQEVLRAAGVGQLEVVKRANEAGEPFVVIDGQVFIADATIKTAVIEPGRFEIKMAVNENGRHVAAGSGVGVQECSDLRLGSQLADGIRNLLRDELKPGGMLHRPSNQRSN